MLTPHHISKLSHLCFVPACLACAGPTNVSAESAQAQNSAADLESVGRPPSHPGPSAREIKAVVDRSEPEVRQCYIAGTFKDAQLAGTVSVTFTIETSGAVSQAVDGGSNLPDAEVVDCVVNVFSQLVFRPGGSGPTEVTYPISFGTRG